MRRQWAQVFAASGAQAYSLLVGVVVLMLSARWLGPEGRGVVAAVTAWLSLLASFAGLSLGQVTLRVATERRGQAWFGPALGSLFWVCLGVSALLWLAAFLLEYVRPTSVFGVRETAALVVGLSGIPFFIWDQYGSGLLSVLGRLSVYNKALVIGRTVALATVVGATVGRAGPAAFVAALVVGQAVTSTITLFALRRMAPDGWRPDRGMLAGFLRGGARLHLNFVGGVLITSAPVLIVHRVLGNAPTGEFQLASQLVQMLAIAPQAAALVIAHRISEQGADAAWGVHRRLILGVLSGLVVLAVLAALLAPHVVPLLGGRRFIAAIPTFRVLLLTVPGLALATLVAPQWIARGRLLALSVISVSFGAMLTVTLLKVVPRWGVAGAAWAMVSIYAIAALIQLGMIWVLERKSRSNAGTLGAPRGTAGALEATVSPAVVVLPG